jgi:cytochrome c peroxidase
VPDDNPLTPAKVALGRQLFFDRRLSRNDTISCAMCHVPEQGFANNEMATAVGIEGRTVRRNAPTIYNTAYLSRLFHDGRSNSLEEQAWGPMLAPNEMGNPSRTSLVEKLRRLDDYPKRFSEAFPERGLDADTIAMALASYERTLVSGGSDFDRYFYGNDRSALSDAAGRGLELFTGNAGCATCHPLSSGSSLFSDGGFHNTGVGVRAADHSGSGTLRVQAAPGVYLDVPRSIVADVSEAPHEDLGRYEVTADPADLHRYRTPTLRNVALTAPYMHDGSIATLRGVVEFYRAGGVQNPGLDPRVRPLALTDADISNLVAFLESLTGPDVDTLVADAFAAPVGDR